VTHRGRGLDSRQDHCQVKQVIYTRDGAQANTAFNSSGVGK